MLDMAAYEKEKRLAPCDIYPIVQSLYPKYRPNVHSNVKNPDCGVCLRPEAEILIVARFGRPAAATPRKRVKHDKAGYPHRMYFRLDDGDHENLMRIFKELGFTTNQDGLVHMTRYFITGMSRLLNKKERAK